MVVKVAGSINIDLVQSVSALPRPGETVMALGSARLPGGKGANQAAASARIGARTLMIGAVGDDEGGRWMIDQLANCGVETCSVAQMAGLTTGAAYIAVDAGGENQIIVAPGANAALSAQHVGAASEGGDVLIAQLEVPIETVRAFLPTSPNARCIRILNAAPAVPGAQSLFDLADILIVNQHELAFYLGLPQAPHDVQGALAARQLISRAEQVVVVTLGALGAVAVRHDSHVHVPALPVVPLDTIGAGDCFVGTLAAALDSAGSARMSVEDALPLANAAAALCTQKPGAIPAMPTLAEAEALIASVNKSRGPS